MGSVLSPPIAIPGMWFTRPAYDSYTPYYSYVPHGYGHSSRGDPLTRAAARDREAATRYRPAPPRWQDTTRSPYNSYLSDDDDDGSFVPYLYDPRTHSYTPHVDEDLRLRQSLEQQRQLQLAHQAELNRRREAKRAQELVERTYRSQEPEPTPSSAPHFPVPISSPNASPSASPATKPTQFQRYPSPPPSPKSTTLEATREEIRAAMTIQEFYRKRVARQQALTSIDNLSTQFDQLKSTFSHPPRLDYQGHSPNSVITIDVPSSIPPSFEDAEDVIGTSKSTPGLAFTSNNTAVHGYIESLGQLLVKLDVVDSGGNDSVREQRKQVVRRVEAEALRMDRWITAVWNGAQPQAQAQPQHNR